MLKNNLFSKNIGMLLLLFPFASPVPLFTDVQPLCFLYAGLYLIFTNVGIQKKDLIVLLPISIFALASLIVINVDGNYLINRRVGGVAVAIVFIFLLKHLDSVSPEFVKGVMRVHLAIMIFQYTAPGLFEQTLAHFIRASTYFEGDSRGVSGLNAEPGGAAAVMFGLFVLHQYLIKDFILKQKNKETFEGFFYFLSGMLLTHGGISVVLFLVVALYLIIELGYWKIALISLIIILSIFLYLIGGFDGLRELGRGAALLVAFINEGFEIIFTDGSVAERFLGLMYGYFSLQLNPFGVGGGGYAIAAAEVEALHSLEANFYTARSQIEDTVSVVGIYLAEYGLFFLIFIFLIIYLTRPRLKSFYLFQMIGVSFLFFSYSFAFPITWLIFVCCYLERRSWAVRPIRPS